MFYCEECRVKNRWPKAFSFSYGRCELCEKTRECHDRPSSSLPAAFRGIDQKEAVKLLLDLKEAEDHELVHDAADEVLLQFLRDNGFEEVATAYEELRFKVGFSYA